MEAESLRVTYRCGRVDGGILTGKATLNHIQIRPRINKDDLPLKKNTRQRQKAMLKRKGSSNVVPPVRLKV